MEKSEFKPDDQENLRVFLFSLIDDPQFEKMIDLLERYPAIADGFFRCFKLKRQFVQHGGDQLAWDYIMNKEKDMMENIEALKKDCQAQ